MSSKIRLRLLYLPLEEVPGIQSGPRAAFEELKTEGRLEDYLVFPFLYEAKRLGSWGAMLNKLFATAVAFQPTAIYWHLQNSGIVPREFTRKLKNLESKPVLCQSTGDSYWKPPKPMVEFGREIDVTFLSGTGMANAFVKACCKNVRLLPEPVDLNLHGKPWTPTSNRSFDVVMVANRIWSRNPFRVMDGQRERVRLIRSFERKLGKKFGLFGIGWENISSCWRGLIPKDSIEEVLRDSWVSVGTNNWNNIAHYFSDRQLISMASGVPHVCRYIPGLEDYFIDGKHCLFFRTVDEAIEKCEMVLRSPIEFQNTVGKVGAELVITKYSAKERMVQVVEILEEVWNCREYSQPLPPPKYKFFLQEKSVYPKVF